MMHAQPPTAYAEAPAPSYAHECARGRALADHAITASRAGLGPLAFQKALAGYSALSQGQQAGFAARLAEEIAGR